MKGNRIEYRRWTRFGKWLVGYYAQRYEIAGHCGSRKPLCELSTDGLSAKLPQAKHQHQRVE